MQGADRERIESWSGSGLDLLRKTHMDAKFLERLRPICLLQVLRAMHVALVP